MTKALPTISIVTTCLNHGHFLEACIQSVLSQNYPNLQHIIIDGGSTDNTLSLLQKYEDRLHFWASDSGLGQYEGLNVGFEKASGHVFAWLNADDYYCPWTFATVAAIMQEVPECAWLTTLNKISFDAGGFPRLAKVKGYSRESFLDGRHTYGAKVSLGGIQQESTFWRRELWDKSGGALDVSYEYAADFELWARFYEYAELYATVSPMGGPRLHAEQRHLLNEAAYVADTEKVMRVVRSRLAPAWEGYDGTRKNYNGFRVRRGIGPDEKWYGEKHSFSG
jgi:glycosyltransferase involved in cell wall biosynthesis